MKRFVRCKECDACQREDCGECDGCRSAVVKYGSSGKAAKSKCKLRKCENPQERPPKVSAAPKEIYYAKVDKKKENPYDLTPGATDQFEGFPDDKLPGQRVSFGNIKRKSDKKQWADKHFEWLMKERKRERHRLAQSRFQAKKKSKKVEEATNATVDDKTAELEKEKSDLVERNNHLMAIANDLQTRNNLLEGENSVLKGQLQTMQQQQQGPAYTNNYYGPVISGENISVGNIPVNVIHGGDGAPIGGALANGAIAAGASASTDHLLLPAAEVNGNDAAAAAESDG